MKKDPKRKICFVITSGIHYSRSSLILKKLSERRDVELQIVVAASAILPQYSDVVPLIEADGFSISAKITMVLEGGNPVAMAKTTGIGVTEFATAFDNLRPDIIVVRGDRYEVLAPAIAGAYLNIPVAHIEGGDVSGTIDESVRHAITKLSHIHFTTHEEAKRRVLAMGEHPAYVFNVGAPELELLERRAQRPKSGLINYLGVGDTIDLDRPFLMVMHHPVTSEVGRNREHVEETLHAVRDIGMPTIWFWPNPDAGTNEVSKGIRIFREIEKPDNIRFIKCVPPEQFIGLLKKTSALVGNSSAGIKEASFLGTPVVNIGSRQQGRARAKNVIDVPYDRTAIRKAILRQVHHGRYAGSKLYFKKGTSSRISSILATVQLYTQKAFHDSSLAR
jgi:UDP-hydrolysing UDP-N-acetyl-D-glucosamine 2-epimerase